MLMVICNPSAWKNGLLVNNFLRINLLACKLENAKDILENITCLGQSGSTEM